MQWLPDGGVGDWLAHGGGERPGAANDDVGPTERRRGRRMQHHAPIGRPFEDLATGGGDPFREPGDRQLDGGGEAVLADDPHVKHAMRPGREERFVGVDFKQEVGLRLGDLDGVGELRPTPQVQVADFERVGPVGGDVPVLKPGVGRLHPLECAVVGLGDHRSLVVQNAEVGVDRRPALAGRRAKRKLLPRLRLEPERVEVGFRLDGPREDDGNGAGLGDLCRVVGLIGLEQLGERAGQHSDIVERGRAQQWGDGMPARGEVGRGGPVEARLGGKIEADQLEPGGLTGSDHQRRHLGHERALVGFEGVGPVGVPQVPHIADLEQVIARLGELVEEQGVAGVVVVAGGQHGTGRRAEGDEWINAGLHVVQPIEQALRPHTEDHPARGVEVELVEIEILGFFDGATQGGGQGHHLGLGGEVVVGGLGDDRVAGHHQLSHGGGPQGGQQAEIADPRDGVRRDGEPQLGGGAGGLLVARFARRGFEGDHLARHSRPRDNHAIRPVQVVAGRDDTLGGCPNLCRRRLDAHQHGVRVVGLRRRRLREHHHQSQGGEKAGERAGPPGCGVTRRKTFTDHG